MSNLTQTELTKVRKSALHSVAISSEMKTSAVDTKLRVLSAEIKKLLSTKSGNIEVICLKISN